MGSKYILDLLNNIKYINIENIILLIVMITLFIISIVDIKTQIVPNKAIVFLLILWFLYKIVLNQKNILYMLISGLFAGGFFMLLNLVSNGGMGGGDIKLMFSLGLFLGIQKTIITIIFTFIIAGVISIFLLITKIKGRKDKIPFVPFITIGFIIGILLGDKLIQFYLY